MNLVLFGIILYIIIQLGIGFVVSRSIRTEDDYLLAGRKLGYILATFSIFATWFGAESCIGTAGAAYEDGLAGVSADPFGYGVCLILMGLFIAIPLWKMKITTIADFFRIRFSARTEQLTALLMIPTSLLWAAAQIRAFGQVLSASSELNVTIAVTIAAAVVILYTYSGGMWADAITDIIQGSVLLVGLVLLVPLMVGDLGGVSRVIDLIPAEKLSFISSSSGLSGPATLRVMEAWAIPICGSIIAQELVSRVISSKSPQVAQRSSLIAAALYIVVGLIPLTIGLIGSRLIPGLEHPEQILPLMARQHLSSFFYVVFSGAIVSAILSTVDSTLLAASGLMFHNIVFPLKRGISESTKVRLERFGVVVLGLLAYLLALYAEGVYALVKDASSFGSAGIFIVFLFGMYTRFGDSRNAIAALAAGACVWLVSHYGFAFSYSYLFALATSLLAYVLMFLFPSRSIPGRTLS
jgi:Na+/proline symporter